MLHVKRLRTGGRPFDTVQHCRWPVVTVVALELSSTLFVTRFRKSLRRLWSSMVTTRERKHDLRPWLPNGKAMGKLVANWANGARGGDGNRPSDLPIRRPHCDGQKKRQSLSHLTLQPAASCRNTGSHAQNRPDTRSDSLTAHMHTVVRSSTCYYTGCTSCLEAAALARRRSRPLDRDSFGTAHYTAQYIETLPCIEAEGGRQKAEGRKGGHERGEGSNHEDLQCGKVGQSFGSISNGGSPFSLFATVLLYCTLC